MRCSLGSVLQSCNVYFRNHLNGETIISLNRKTLELFLPQQIENILFCLLKFVLHFAHFQEFLVFVMDSFELVFLSFQLPQAAQEV